MVKLSPRLMQVANLIPSGRVVADIGTDHALIPLYLVENNTSPRVIAIEAKTEPFTKAQQNLGQHPLGLQVDLRLGDGFTPLSREDEVEVAVIAGMGGTTIQEILTAGIPHHEKMNLFILQPMTRCEELRIWLLNNKLRIVQEALARDDGRIYEVLAVKRGEMPAGDIPFLEFGPRLIEKKDPLFKEYICEKIRKTEIVLASLDKSQSNTREVARSQFERRLERLKEVLVLVTESTDNH